MNAAFLKRLIENKEIQTTEFKRGFPGSEKASETMAAFANTDGGFLIIGVEDSGKIAGLRSDEISGIQANIAQAASAVKPQLVVSVELIEIEGKKIIAVKVPKTSPGCHTFKGRLFARIGSTTKHLEGEAQLEFLRNKGALMFDEIFSAATIEDIEKEKATTYLKKRGQADFLNSKSIEDFLINARLAALNGEFKIKNPAILLFGKQPQKLLPQAEIRTVCFKGEKGGEILSSKIITGTIDQQIEEAILFIQKNTKQAFTIKPEDLGKRTEVYEYPPEAVREVVVNAVAHRDYFSQDAIQVHIYNNRIEVSNPGSLLKGITKETLGKRSVLRNPTIYRLLRDYGYMEGLGQGIAKICNLMRNANLGDPFFDIDEFFFQITLSSKKTNKQAIETEGDLKPRQKTAIVYLRKKGTMKREEYEKVAKVSYVTAIKDIEELLKFNFIEKVGKYRGAYYVIKK